MLRSLSLKVEIEPKKVVFEITEGLFLNVTIVLLKIYLTKQDWEK